MLLAREIIFQISLFLQLTYFHGGQDLLLRDFSSLPEFEAKALETVSDIPSELAC